LVFRLYFNPHILCAGVPQHGRHTLLNATNQRVCRRGRLGWQRFEDCDVHQRLVHEALEVLEQTSQVKRRVRAQAADNVTGVAARPGARWPLDEVHRPAVTPERRHQKANAPQLQPSD
jgi:hypothetical protein